MIEREKNEVQMTKQEIAEMLRNNVKVVSFTRADGTERVMKCTLMEKYLPEQVELEEYVARKQNDNVCSVWDIDKAAWRSFRVDSVKEIN